MIFLKAGSCAIGEGSTFRLPPYSNDVHYEIEVALRFGDDLALSAWTLAIDLTDRTAQTAAKDKRLPWTLAKSFRNACLLGNWIPLKSTADLAELGFQLKVNSAVVQKGNVRDMIHPIEKVRAYVVERFPVIPGDVLLTGTPAGVGPLYPGDVLEAEAGTLAKARWQAAKA
jgi:2-keto-4-pentenoate hydratase/2-oxohepta-3-ene-1,7-dioic acid hydratase in catechol pathway